jgi:hypothetical protein
VRVCRANSYIYISAYLIKATANISVADVNACMSWSLPKGVRPTHGQTRGPSSKLPDESNDVIAGHKLSRGRVHNETRCTNATTDNGKARSIGSRRTTLERSNYPRIGEVKRPISCTPMAWANLGSSHPHENHHHRDDTSKADRAFTTPCIEGDW